MTEDYKLYVWHHVLTDYTSGMIVIHARNLNEAYEIASKQQRKKENYTPLMNEIGSKKPNKIISKGGIDWVYGGG